jgi:hypothetical protein
MDDIVQWDECGDDAGDFTTNPYVRRVDDRNEPDPKKWLPSDPFGPAEGGYAVPVGNTTFPEAHRLRQRSEEAVKEPALHDVCKQPDAEPNEARDDDEHGGSDPRGAHDARTLRSGTMRMRSELRLSGHPGPATESQCIRNDDPCLDSAATSFLSSHGYIVGA